MDCREDALVITGLRKVYDNGFEALKGLNLNVGEGDFFALLGPNGAGKTTAIGIITSLVLKTSGTVRVFGVDIDQDFPAAKRLIGIVPQEFNFSLFEKVGDIIMQQAGYYGIGRFEARQRTEKYLKKLGLWEKRDAQAQELSGGMKRRLMIARGLIHDPRLLILDEPTAGVDVELRRGMWEFLAEINRNGKTIILTTHYLEEAEQLCNRIAIISDGKIVENSSKRDLLRKLDHESFVFELRDEIEGSEISPLEGAAFSYGNDGTLIVTKDKDLTINALFAHLEAEGIVVESLRNKTNRLEELFLEMVES